MRLHPVQRTAVGTIADATDAEHHAAYLQHDTQGETIVRFFLQYFRSSHSIEHRGMRIIVYTRFDSPILDLVASAMSFGMQMANAAGASFGPIDLEIYNNTGTGITGYH